MNLTTKGINAISAMLFLATQESLKEPISLVVIANKLNLSKLYLEQIFSILKKEQLICSKKGPTGGYQLQKKANQINLFEIIKATEPNWFYQKKEISNKDSIEILITNHILEQLNNSIIQQLSNITLDQLLLLFPNNCDMYYI